MLTVAVTGGIGSGKSLVGDYLEALGAIVIDSDQLARAVIERGTPGFDEVVSRFGDKVLRDGLIDRVALGEIVFADPVARKDLEAIIHPRVRAETEAVIGSAPEGSVVVNQIPLLVETNGASRFDYVITVEAPEEMRIARLKERGMKEYDARKRMSAQASTAEREAVADLVLDNSGSKEELLRQVERAWNEELKPRALGRL
ncbi:MAG: dephospho-CoA kinase [Actinomycetota bacterium]